MIRKTALPPLALAKWLPVAHCAMVMFCRDMSQSFAAFEIIMIAGPTADRASWQAG